MTITIILICLLIIVVVQYIALCKKNKEIRDLKRGIRNMAINQISIVKTLISERKEKENVNRKCNRSSKTKSSANA